MKAIIVETLEQFETLQFKIHNSLKVIPGYSEARGFLRWAEPTLQNTVTGFYACPVEDVTTLRGAVMNSSLTQLEKDGIVDLDMNDETWFPKIEMI